MDDLSKHLSGDWRRHALAGFCVIGLTFGVLGGWAAVAPLDSAVVSGGAITVESERKAVQHLEGGIVRGVEVAEGQRVAEGQVLVRIDQTQARAQADMYRNGVAVAQAEEARLAAEVAQSPEVDLPPHLRDPAAPAEVKRAVADQMRQFRERRAARDNEVAILAERLGQAERQRDGSLRQAESARKQIASVTEELDRLRPVAERGLVPLTRITTLERSRTDLEGRVGALLAETERLDRAAQEARLQASGVARRFMEEASAKIAETRSRLADLLERQRVAEDVLSRSEVKSPRAGRVVGLKVHTVGAVVRPGDTLMEVVPEDDVLVVTARMSPLDVDHVHPGLAAEVRLPSLRSRTAPIAVGEVRAIGADVLRDEVTRQPYYEMRVSVSASSFPEEVRSRLKPGMPAEVVVSTGERTVLAYLVQPLADAMRIGMREH